MASNRFVKNKNLLILLSSCKKKLRNAILQNVDKDIIFSICECILNVCNGNIKLIKENHNKLKQYNSTFKRLLNKKESIKKKKKILVQKGGFLQFLIPAIISGVAEIISSTISKSSE